MMLSVVAAPGLALSQGKPEAGPPAKAAPEIGTGSAASALVLISGALLVMRGRRKK
jgi:hypothetical protein